MRVTALYSSEGLVARTLFELRAEDRGRVLAIGVESRCCRRV